MISSRHTLLRLLAKLTRCLSLALLPALASEARALSVPQRKPLAQPAKTASSQPRITSESPSTPYLASLGSLPLRFARPDLERTDEPPAPPEPPPAKASAPLPDSPEKAAPGPAADQAAPPATPGSAEPPSEQKQPPSAVAGEPAPTAPPLPILPDDTKREIRPEEVLLFFRYPGTGPSPSGNSAQIVIPVTPAPPQPATAPPSSATYQLK